MAEEGEITLDLGRANPKQALFYASRTLYTAYGGARGGGKTHALRIKAVSGALTWAGIRILVLRRTYPELQSGHIKPIVRLVPPELGRYNTTQRTMYFVNGSTIRFGHFSGLAGETEYQGQEFDWIFMDEATQFTYGEFRTLGGCLRGVNDIPKRFYLTCNPGGVGHAWVKRLFIDREFRSGGEGGERGEDYSFIFATVEDNKPLLKSSPAYLQMLSSLPEHLRRAHRYGDWDALAGAYFPEFSEEKHVCEPFAIPPEWPRFRAFDYGLDMFACCWAAVDGDGRCWIYREVKRPGLIVSQAAEAMREATLPGERIALTYAPPDMWSTQKDTGKTMAEVFTLCGIPIVRSSNARVQGHLQIKELLRVRPDGRPGLMVFSDCRELIRDVQSIQSDPQNPSDCAKAPHEVTHMVDALRYFCVNRALPPDRAEKPRARRGDYEGYMTGGEAPESYMEYF
ncbi:MAG: phage terminase large subunit [Oscillospiraceae bacterium]|nr:phage terminase large subunit [Oscillospiraceae bacterium]